jgi:hypothetical protein
MKITTQSQVFALIILSVIEVSISWFSGDSVCEENDTYVDCRNKNLTEVPKLPNLRETVTHLDFSFNNIRTVSMSRYSIFEIPNGENVSSSMVSRSFPLKFNFLN